MKKITAGFLMVLLLLNTLITGAKAEETDDFKVILKAGAASGEDILLDPAEHDLLAETWDQAKPGQFFKDETTVYLRLPNVPEDFEAPEEN